MRFGLSIFMPDLTGLKFILYPEPGCDFKYYDYNFIVPRFQAVIASLLDSYNLVILGVFLLPNLTLVESLLVLAATSSTSHSLRLVISSCKEAGDSPTVFSESTLASIIQLSTCVCLFISSYHSHNSKHAFPSITPSKLSSKSYSNRFRCDLHLTDIHKMIFSTSWMYKSKFWQSFFSYMYFVAAFHLFNALIKFPDHVPQAPKFQLSKGFTLFTFHNLFIILWFPSITTYIMER